MNMSKLNRFPDAITIHDSYLHNFEFNKNEVRFRFEFGSYHYFLHEKILKDIYLNPEECGLVLDLVFKEIQIKELSFSSQFALGQDSHMIGLSNDYDENTKIISLSFDDGRDEYFDISFTFESFEWIYIDEVKIS